MRCKPKVRNAFVYATAAREKGQDHVFIFYFRAKSLWAFWRQVWNRRQPDGLQVDMYVDHFGCDTCRAEPRKKSIP